MSGSSERIVPVLSGRSCRIVLDRPRIMGILNVTPDSFSDGGRFLERDQALAQARKMISAGADLIDVGGESTRPGAAPVSQQEELDRVLPVIEALVREIGLPLSVDTSKSRVAREAVAAGADFVNDISGLGFDADMATTVAENAAGLFLMHTRGRPDRMQSDTQYDDLVSEVCEQLQESVNQALEAGVDKAKIAVDPGIGFGKDVAGNLELLRSLPRLAALGYPLLIGTSRKSFIGRVLGNDDPAERLNGTLATVALGVSAGARIFRVHDVKEAAEAARMAWAVCQGGDWQA